MKKLILGILVAFAPLVFAVPLETPTDRLLQQQVKQEQIRTTTDRVGKLLSSVIEEYERNGLTGDDVEILKAIRGVLGKLSEKEIQRVVELLRDARNDKDDGAVNRRIVDAFTGQKGIVVQLRQLLLEYQRQQALHQLSLRFAALAVRQNANLKEGVGLESTGRVGSGRFKASIKI